MGQRQLTTPYVIRGGIAIALQPVPLDEQFETEEWFQKLLFDHSDLIPIAEIEPGFGRLIPIGREIHTERGPIDLLLMDTSGHLVVVETKLYRNPEARRKVVGQILEYAANLATWSYADLTEAVISSSGATGKDPKDPLVSLARSANDPDFDEARFIEAVTLNLERGRFLLIVAGDGMHEGVTEIERLLQREPGLSFRFALVEFGLFKLADTPDVFIQPRIVAMTREITRAIVEVRPPLRPGDVVVKAPPDVSVRAASKNQGARTSLTEEDFFKALAATDAGAADLTRIFLGEAPEHRLRVHWQSNGPTLKYATELEGEVVEFNFGQFTGDATLAYSNWLSAKCNRLELPQSIWKEYYETLVRLIPGSRMKEGREKDVSGSYVFLEDQNSDEPDVRPLLRKRDAWWQAIDEVIERLEKAIAART